MPKADFFARFGLHIIKDFLDAHDCERLRSEARYGPSAQARVYGEDGNFLNEEVRLTQRAEVSAAAVAMVEERLLAVKPVVERHFNLVLAGCQKPQFLIYKEGGHYRPHRDNWPGPAEPEYLRERKVSVVIFLNGQAEEPGPESYCGGALTFYGLFDDPRVRELGIPLSGEAGLMVAFRSDLFHAVSPVTQGERHSIVSWYI